MTARTPEIDGSNWDNSRDLAVPDAEEISYIVHCFRLFNGINQESWAPQRGLADAKVARTVALIESLHQLVAAK
jgi:hypothetical protein